jgi:hypothetical protein
MMPKDIENKIVEEFLDIVNIHTIPENHTVAKNKKHPLKTAAAIAIAGAIIISLTVGFQSDSLKKNQTATTIESQRVKKTANTTHLEPDSAGEMSYTTDMALPQYLDEVYSTDAGSEMPEGTKLENL